MWAVPNKEIFWISETLGRPGIDSTPFAKSFPNFPTLCYYDHQDDLGFHIPRPVNFDLQILVLANFFSFFERDVLSSGTETSISIRVLDFWSRMTTSRMTTSRMTTSRMTTSWMTTSGLLAFLIPLIIDSSFLYCSISFPSLAFQAGSFQLVLPSPLLLLSCYDTCCAVNKFINLSYKWMFTFDDIWKGFFCFVNNFRSILIRILIRSNLFKFWLKSMFLFSSNLLFVFSSNSVVLVIWFRRCWKVVSVSIRFLGGRSVVLGSDSAMVSVWFRRLPLCSLAGEVFCIFEFDVSELLRADNPHSGIC